MIFRVIEVGDGVELDGPTGKIRVYLEPTQETGDVHIKEPGEDIDDDLCRIHGDTYNSKDLIKKLPYGRSGTQWNGEVWTVHKKSTADLCAVLKIAARDVTLDSRAIAHDDDWGILQEEIELDEGGNETYKVINGPSDPGQGVSRSWAEDAADLGNYDSADAFAEQFNLEIVEDSDMEERAEDADSPEGADPFSTE